MSLGRIKPKRVGGFPRPERPPEERVRDFNEIFIPYTEGQAIEEAKRCILCPIPQCVKACPVRTDVPGMIEYIQKGDFRKALEMLRETNCLPGTTGTVCPQLGKLCEANCVVGKVGEPVAIGLLQRFLADWERKNRILPKEIPWTTGKSIAIIGGGPAGLAAAELLKRYGHRVVIFESKPMMGGTAMYGIPEFHLSKEVLSWEVEYIKALGVEFRTGVTVGKDLRLKDIFEEGFDAILITTGPGDVKRLRVPGEDLKGVYNAYEFIFDVNEAILEGRPLDELPYRIKGMRVAVIGGGDTALDASKLALRMGAKEVIIVYRRSEAEMPGYFVSRNEAKAEGVKLMILTNPVRFIGGEDGWVKQMECIKMRLGEPDESGRRRPIPIPGSNFIMDVDAVIVAIGRGPNSFLARVEGLEMTRWGGIKINPETYETSMPNVYAAGDVVTGETLVVEAMAEGRKAAQRIHEKLMGLPPTDLDKLYFEERYRKRILEKRKKQAKTTQ